MLAHRRFFGTIDVPRPLRCVRVLTPTQAREQCELQMIVRIDQAGQDMQPIEIELDSFHDPRHTLIHRATKIAGCREASSNAACFPAWANTARSGSPNRGSTRTSNR